MWNDVEIRGHVEYLNQIENAVLKAIDKGYRNRDQIHEFVDWMLNGNADKKYVDVCIGQNLRHDARERLENL